MADETIQENEKLTTAELAARREKPSERSPENGQQRSAMFPGGETEGFCTAGTTSRLDLSILLANRCKRLTY